jgi:hypothetical protein
VISEQVVWRGCELSSAPSALHWRGVLVRILRITLKAEIASAANFDALNAPSVLRHNPLADHIATAVRIVSAVSKRRLRDAKWVDVE